MEDLNKLRAELDAIDDELVEMFKRRFTAVDRIAHAKRNAQLQIFDPKREQEILERIATHAGDDLSNDLTEIWRCIMSVAKRRESNV